MKGEIMKKRLLIFIAAIIFIGGIILVILNNLDHYYAKKLVHAIRSEDMATIEEILETRPSCVDTYPQTAQEKLLNVVFEQQSMPYPIVAACKTDNFEIVKLLVEKGADLDCNDGSTPLSVTYSEKSEHWYQISTYLIENGASLDYIIDYSWGYSSILSDIVTSRGGVGRLEYVTESETEVMDAFLYALEHCDHSKVAWIYVLRDSVMYDRIEIVELLLDGNYCDANDASISGLTPLIFAARFSTSEVVQVLLDRGADKDYIDPEGKTAYDYAIECENYEVAELLSD